MILYAEDEQHDVYFMRRAFTMVGVTQPLIHVCNGQEAILYLKGESAYADRSLYPKPQLLLLDLNMPLVNGFEVLDWLAQHPQWRQGLSIIVLSSSNLDADLQKAQQLGANDYLVKPNDFNQLLTLARDLKQRWIDPLTEASVHSAH